MSLMVGCVAVINPSGPYSVATNLCEGSREQSRPFESRAVSCRLPELPTVLMKMPVEGPLLLPPCCTRHIFAAARRLFRRCGDVLLAACCDCCCGVSPLPHNNRVCAPPQQTAVTRICGVASAASSSAAGVDEPRRPPRPSRYGKRT